MKSLLLSFALTCALTLPAFCQFGNATRIQNNPVKPGLTCSDTQVIVWVAAHGQFECGASGAGGIVVTGTPSVGWEIVATSASTATWQAVLGAPFTCSFSGGTTCTMSIPGKALQAVWACFDTSGTRVELIPNSFAGSDADTLVLNAVGATTGGCNAVTGVGATGATGATGPAGTPGGSAGQFQWNSAGTTFAGAPNLLRRSATAVGVGVDAASASATTATMSILDFTTAAINEGLYLELDKAGKTQAVLRGIDAELYTSAASNITTATGETVIISNDGASTMGSATGIRVSLENVGGSTITDEFGINVIGDPSTGVTNKHGLYIGTQSGASGVNSAIETELGVVTFGDVMTSANVKRGAGTPEGAVVGVVGDIYQRTDGGTGTSLYRKESGSSNTGWVAVASGGASPGGADLSLQYRIDGTTFGGMSGTSWDDTNRILNLLDPTLMYGFTVTADADVSAANGGLIFLGQTIKPTAQTMGNGLDGGAVDLRAYTGGDTSDAAAFGGAGGQFVAKSGSGGAGGMGGLGADLTFTAGTGGHGSAGDGGAGGNVNFFAGFAGTGGNANGGIISFQPGQGKGTGTNGDVFLGTSATSAFHYNGSFAPLPCTAASLSTDLLNDGDICFCTDCKVTTVSVNVVSNATCTGTGSGSLAIRIASTPKCQYLP